MSGAASRTVRSIAIACATVGIAQRLSARSSITSAPESAAERANAPSAASSLPITGTQTTGRPAPSVSRPQRTVFLSIRSSAPYSARPFSAITPAYQRAESLIVRFCVV